jgi:phage gpG-like protein
MSARNLVKIEFTFPDWEKRVRDHKKDINMAIAASLQTNRAMLFDRSGNYNGHQKWPKPVFRKGKPLMDRGTLKKSIAPKNDGKRPGYAAGTIVQVSNDRITIGTSIAYAKPNNEGATIVAKKAQALMIPIPGGANATRIGKSQDTRRISLTRDDNKIQKMNVIFRKKVVIPARNFDSLTPQDLKELRTTAERMVRKVMVHGRL